MGNSYSDIFRILSYFNPYSENTPKGSFFNKHFSNSLKDDKIFDIVILGLPDNEGVSNYICANNIRSELYKLSTLQKNFNIFDIGNFIFASNINECQNRFNEVFSALQKYNLKIVIIGGTSELIHKFIYNYYWDEELPLNIVALNSTINWEHLPVEPLSNNPVDSVRGNLINFINLGYQNYFVEEEILNFLHDANFEAYRLGLVRYNSINYEPLIRDANVLNLSLNAVKISDAPAASISSPNGFSADEFCQIANYGGYSSSTTVFSVTDINPDFEYRNSTFLLAAQSLWYIFEGINNNILEDPILTPDNFVKYHIHLNIANQDLAFYYSNITNRWWMEVVIGNKREILISCTQKDYELACNQEIPDRWWRLFNRIED